MGAVHAVFRAELRRRALAFLLLSVVVGVAAGAVVALAAAAARTESAYDRFLERSAPSDVLIQASSGFLGPAVDLEAVAALPEVEQAARGVVLFTGARLPDGRQLRFGDLAGVATIDGDYGRTVDRETVLEGRRADASRADEMVLGFDAAERFGIEVGDTVDLVLPTAREFDAATVTYGAQLEEFASGRGTASPFDIEASLPGSLHLAAKVVGIVAAPTEVPPIAGTLTGLARLTPAFFDKYAADLAGAGFLAVRVRPGTGIEKFKTAVERLEGGRDAVFLTSEPTQTAAVNRSLNLQATALRLIAGLVLVVALALVGPDARTAHCFGVRRLPDPPCARHDAGRALRTRVGTRGDDRHPDGGRVRHRGDRALPGVPGRPRRDDRANAGHRRRCDHDRDRMRLAPVRGAAPRRVPGVEGRTRRGRAPLDPRARLRLASFLGGSRRTAMPLGVRLALEPGRGRRSVPVRTAIAVVGVAIAAAAMTVGLSSSFERLRDAPRLYGWSWDAQVGATGLPDVSRPLVAGLKKNAAVADIAVGTTANVSIDGTRSTHSRPRRRAAG